MARDGRKAKGKSKTPFFLAGVAWDEYVYPCIRNAAKQGRWLGVTQGPHVFLVSLISNGSWRIRLAGPALVKT